MQYKVPTTSPPSRSKRVCSRSSSATPRNYPWFPKECLGWFAGVWPVRLWVSFVCLKLKASWVWPSRRGAFVFMVRGPVTRVGHPSGFVLRYRDVRQACLLGLATLAVLPHDTGCSSFFFFCWFWFVRVRGRGQLFGAPSHGGSRSPLRGWSGGPSVFVGGFPQF